ncbi:MAG: carboxypeptidase regulatory-like domain-containing protein, partial [Pyrinomonadaceae bacterium]|nr:carboxypeptidase regulatory-like domain-containing protein [Pyrinomonadaceae bacterium]
KSNYSVNNDKVFTLGMSAGAAMSVIMGATYPDIFAGVGASAGLEFRAGDNAVTAVLAQETMGPDPNMQGEIAFRSMGSFARRMPTIVFHGTLDQTVRNTNGTQIIEQYAQTNDFIDDGVDNNSVDAIADQTILGTAPQSGGLTYTRTIYNDASGKPLMEKWFVDNMTHSWSGGSSAGSFTNPNGPSASFEMCRFFGVCTASAVTAAGVTIGGRVTLSTGKGVNNVTVRLEGGNSNAPRYVRTNAFGYYRFANVATGENYILSATHKRYNFEESTLTINLLGEIQDANFTALR